jgi:hypothetical protein
MTVIVRSAATDVITLPLRLAHLDQFLSLRGALANADGFDEALKANEQSWQAWTKTESV